MSISERLKQLLEQREWSTRRFQEEVRARAGKSTRGVSYSSVYEYVEGRTEPPLSFLRVAADVLGVRESWLTTGEGPKTDEHAAEAYAAGTVAAEVAERVLAEIRAGFSTCGPEEGKWLESDAFARAALVHAWRRKCEGQSQDVLPEPDSDPDAHQMRVARQLGKALRNTLDALDVDVVAMPQAGREDFVMAMVQAITATAHIPAGSLGEESHELSDAAREETLAEERSDNWEEGRHGTE